MKVLTIIVLFSYISYGEGENDTLATVEFANDILLKMHEGKGNLVVSPFSLQYLLLFVLFGANDQTANEISTVTRLPVKNLDDIGRKFNNIVRVLENYSKYLLNIRNRIYKDLVQPKQSYKHIGKAFNADFHFIDNFTQLPSEISKWIESETSSMITSVNERIDVHIISTIYLIGQWDNARFDKITDLFFSHENNQFTSITYLSTVTNLKYYYDKEIDSEFVELALIKADFSIVFFIPKQANAIDNLNNDALNKILSNRRQYLREKRDVYFQFPADMVKTSSNVYFKQVLRLLGMHTAFSDTANFDKLSEIPLRIEDIIQDTYIDITAVGATVSSASISENRKMRSTPSFTTSVRASQPFMFYVIHDILGVLFAGRYVHN